MSFETDQLTIHDTIEAETLAYNKIMLENYAKAERDIIAELEKFYGKYLSIKSGQLAPENIYNIVIQSDRLNKLLIEVQGLYNYYYKKVAGNIETVSTMAMTNTYYMQQYVLNWYSPVPLDFSMLDPRVVEISVTGSTELWNQIKNQMDMIDLSGIVPPYGGTLKDLLYNNRISDLADIQQTITQGFIQGKSIAQMTADIQDAMGNLSYQAERIARTEAARTADTGARIASQDAADQGLNIKRQWHATRDGKTRDSHISLDGQRVKPDEPFHYHGETSMGIGRWPSVGMNVNCRCTVLTIIDNENPKLMAVTQNPLDDNKKYDVVPFESFKSWAEKNGMKFDRNGMLIRNPNFEG